MDTANNFHNVTDNMLVVPIMMQFSREVVGVLQLINKKVTYISGERRGFTDADKDLLESFLGIAARLTCSRADQRLSILHASTTCTQTRFLQSLAPMAATLK